MTKMGQCGLFALAGSFFVCAGCIVLAAEIVQCDEFVGWIQEAVDFYQKIRYNYKNIKEKSFFRRRSLLPCVKEQKGTHGIL